jgi:nicotinate-nucleotide adenylyltransferase
VRIALFGGTFDPPHVGHLLAASDAHEQLELDQLVFIPASRQPLSRVRRRRGLTTASGCSS